MGTLRKGQTITSATTCKTYRVGALLGKGGYGAAYRATELGRRGRAVGEVCLKTTTDQASWHREAYFGELLRGCRRVIQLHDSFPRVARTDAGSEVQYCLVLELAEHGTIADYLTQRGAPWPAARARREVLALLKMLDRLHGTSATHRDITPINVFVCRRGTLKLGDFGIARHTLAGAPQAVEEFNPEWVTRGHLQDQHRRWIAADDVFQMGQLLAALLRGDPTAMTTPAMAARLRCDEALREVVRRAIGPRHKRYADAAEMLAALTAAAPAPAADLPARARRPDVFHGPRPPARATAEGLVRGRAPLRRAGHPVRTLGDAEFQKIAAG